MKVYDLVVFKLLKTFRSHISQEKLVTLTEDKLICNSTYVGRSLYKQFNYVNFVTVCLQKVNKILRKTINFKKFLFRSFLADGNVC